MKQPETSLSYDDGVDLRALIPVLWQQKWFILFSTLLCTLVGFVFIWLAKPVYVAKAYIYPPTVGDIAAFNYGKSVKKSEFIKVFTVNDIYGIFTHNLFSQAMKQLFFNEHVLPFLPEKKRKKLSYSTLRGQFESQLTIQQELPLAAAKYTIAIKNNVSSTAAEWVKLYISLVNERTVSDVLQIIKRQNNSIVNDLKFKIALTRKVAQKRRQDQLIQLQEDYNIANAIGLKDPFFSQERGYSLQANSSVPRYLSGTKALKTQINILNGRKSDDPFSAELRDAQQELVFYKNININTQNAAVFRLDGSVKISDRLVSSKQRVIMVASIMLGLLLGVSLVIIRNFLFPLNRTDKIR
ncbi:MAG: Wzz/FepE/Etk N-terminal domain-containing protein [Legionella sp.]|nr:Wzz/FepE/Etk N-terminal domain-containing protein [Legionella sp.]